MILVALAILLSWAIGTLAVWMLSPRTQSPWAVALQLCIALVLGLAISSVVSFTFMAGSGAGSRQILLVEVGVLVALVVLSVVTTRAGPGGDMGAIDAGTLHGGLQHSSLLRYLMPLAALIALGFAAHSFIMLVQDRPHGNWDAWAMWNMRARFLYLGGHDWKQAFSPELSGVRPDYPILVPLTVARLWICLGNDSTIIPRIVATLFTSLTLFILFLAVGRSRGLVMASLAACLLLGSSVFVDEGASQYSDMALSCFVLTAIVIMTAASRAQFGMNRLWALAGMASGAAAWTKNEGQLFCAVTCMCLFIATWRMRELKAALRRTAVFVAGASPFLACVIGSKLAFAWRNDLFKEQSTGDAIRLLMDPQRYKVLANWAATILPQCISPWLLLCLAAYLVLNLMCGAHRKGRSGLALPSTVIAFMILGYSIVYLTTPYDQGWHMRTSFSRLLLHLWPSIIFIFFFWGSEHPEDRPVDAYPPPAALQS